jgi:hypothetical protein
MGSCNVHSGSKQNGAEDPLACPSWNLCIIIIIIIIIIIVIICW